MTKLQNPPLINKEFFRNYKWQQFLLTDLGKLYKTIPFEQLADLLPKKKNNIGAPSFLPKEGFFGLMFLKSYLNLSDKKLIQRLNTDWAIQYFCGIQLHENEKIRDKDLPSRIRSYLSVHIQVESFQKVMLKHWKQHMDTTHCLLNDATVYESYIKFPTDVKLLWDCTKYIYQRMYQLCKEFKIKRPKSKFKNQSIKQLAYDKLKKKTYKKTQKRKKALLYLLNKGINQFKIVIAQTIKELPEQIQERLTTIETIYSQQLTMYEKGINSIPDRIVSLFKPYLRPIVRGKEGKTCEFGLKVMTSQVSGINMIDKFDYKAYNESVYLEDSIKKHKERFGECTQVGVDKIYGTNKNRKYMTKNKIHHCLPLKGKASKYEAQAKVLRKEIGKERATVLEGSFGNEKNHYGLRKIKARNQHTELMWILFGIYTANSIKMTKKLENKEKIKKNEKIYKRA